MRTRAHVHGVISKIQYKPSVRSALHQSTTLLSPRLSIRQLIEFLFSSNHHDTSTRPSFCPFILLYFHLFQLSFSSVVHPFLLLFSDFFVLSVDAIQQPNHRKSDEQKPQCPGATKTRKFTRISRQASCRGSSIPPTSAALRPRSFQITPHPPLRTLGPLASDFTRDRIARTPSGGTLSCSSLW